MKLLWSINETQERVNLGRTKIYELIAEGRLELVKVGRKSLVTDASINALVAALVDEAAMTADRVGRAVGGRKIGGRMAEWPRRSTAEADGHGLPVTGRLDAPVQASPNPIGDCNSSRRSATADTEAS
jgi:excisionase family DNA binding protein